MSHLPTLITAVSGLLVVLGGGIAWIARHWDKRKPSLSRQTAAVAEANDAVGGSLRGESAAQTLTRAEFDGLDQEARRAYLAAGGSVA